MALPINLALSEPQLIPYLKADKWGFCTADKKIVIDCIYKFTDQFNNGMAIVVKDDMAGFINKKGEVAIPIIYFDCQDFSEGLAAVAKDDAY